jgi:branched-chain amino acid transport system permease protein
MKDETMSNPAYQDDLTAIKANRRRAIIRTSLVICALVLLPLLVEQRFYRNIMTLVFLWGAMAGAWNILGGYAGKFSLGNAAFFGTGAYTSSILFVKLGVSPWLGMLVGMLISICLALLLGLITLRLKGKFFALCTIAFVAIMEIAAIHLRGLTGGAEGLLIPWKASPQNMMFESDLTWVYVFMTFMLIVYFACRWLASSRIGYNWIALREDEDAAESLGINTLAAKLSAFTISAAFTAIGGSLYAQYTIFIEPIYVFGLELSTQFALYAIIGGMGSAIGPMIGAAIITPLEILLRSSFPALASGASLAMYALLLILVVLFLPRGFVASFGNIFKKLAGRDRDAGQHNGETANA